MVSFRHFVVTVKIMTAIVAIENMSLDKEITVGDEVLKAYGTNTYIEVGENIKVKDLLYGLILRSGNDAALTLAKNIENKKGNFIDLMNEKAKEIGMENTSFANPHGLDEETRNYSTAYDMALLSKYAYRNKIYKTISKTKKYSLKTDKKSYVWYNRNKLLSTYPYCTGGKNGYTPSAGKTLVTTANKDNLNLTVVTINDPNIYDSHKSLYEYYFSKYKKYLIIDKDNFKFDESLIDKNLFIKESFEYPLLEEEKDKIQTKLEISNMNSEKIGQIVIYLDGDPIGKVNVYAKKKQSTKKQPPFFSKIRSWIV